MTTTRALPTVSPPRFRWLLRGTVGVLLLLTALVLLRMWWGRLAVSRFRAAVAAAHARGERVTIDDFNRRPAVDDSDNAAKAYIAAANAIVFNPAESAFDSRYDPSIALSPEDVALLHNLVLHNARAINLSEQGAQRPALEWGTMLRSPAVSVLLPLLNRRRALANMLRYATVDAHLHGDDAETVRLLQVLFSYTDASERDIPLLVDHLVGLGIGALSAQLVLTVAPTLNAPRPAVQALIRQILDESTVQQAGVQAWYGERLFSVDLLEDPGPWCYSYGAAASAPRRRWLVWPITPALRLDGLRMFNWDSAEAAAMAQPSFPAAMAAMPPALPKAEPVPFSYEVSHLVGSIGRGSRDRIAASQFRGITLRRVAAVRLALRLYELDHHGADPRQLEDLVPAYLPAVPIDPFAPDGHALRTTARDGKLQTIYSVGENGRDDGGRLPANPYMLNNFSGLDYVFAVYPPPPRPADTQP